MLLNSLSLANFRSYRQLELELPYPVVLFKGDNGQGKSNLLEAIYFLATTRSLRAGSDRELISWDALNEPIPYARVAGTVIKAGGELRVEIVIRADRPDRSASALGEIEGAPTSLSKRIKINGVVKRALDLLGQINVVMFSPQDLDLIAGAPAIRRRYLDIVNCQVDTRYCRSLQQYNRVHHQRNHLLKQIRDGKQPPETLEFWSEELVKSGAYLLFRRHETASALNARLESFFRRLTGTGKKLRMDYRSTVEEAAAGTEAQRDLASIAELFREGLRRYQKREIVQGLSLLGPHRDDLLFFADGINMNIYGSRGEQRAVALALKLAEVEFLQSTTGERPLLLLDDVMSELDPLRRLLLLETIGFAGQTLVTATEIEPFSPEFLARAALFEIRQGMVELVRKPT